MLTFTLHGTLREKRTGLPLVGYYVKAYDKDLLFDDLLGGAFVDPNGRFSIVCESSDFREFFDTRPDIYFKVYRSDRKQEIYSTKDAVRWDADTSKPFEIEVPDDVLYDAEKNARLEILDDEGQAREELFPHVIGAI